MDSATPIVEMSAEMSANLQGGMTEADRKRYARLQSRDEHRVWATQQSSFDLVGDRRVIDP
ncbi:hypothetical protein EEB13_10935 [Rhodococcus sp. WS3]|nr:hypothetical protein EEB13_10935 [Rhodococcus sp. WS3]